MIARRVVLFMLLLSQFQFLQVVVEAAAACQACLFPVSLLHHHRHHHPHYYKTQPGMFGSSIRPSQQTLLSAFMPFGIIAARHFASRHVPTSNIRNSIFRTDEEHIKKDKNDSEQTRDETAVEEQEESSPASMAAIGAIRFYKGFISPLLPPACRFVPTCSQYGVQAIEEFGLAKGCTLIAWRLLRCSPIGGKGYDPPKWPPVAFNYASY